MDDIKVNQKYWLNNLNSVVQTSLDLLKRATEFIILNAAKD